MAKPVSAPPEATRDTPPCRVQGCNLRGPIKVRHGGAVFPVCKRHQGLWPDVKLKPRAQWEKECTRLQEFAARADRIGIEKGLVKVTGHVVPKARTAERARRPRKAEPPKSARPTRTAKPRSSAAAATRPEVPSIPELRKDGDGNLVDDGVCVVVGCGVDVYCRGACRSHYTQARHQGWRHHLLSPKQGGRPKSGPMPPPELRRDEAGALVDDGVCVVVGCGVDVYCRGACASHYEQARNQEWRHHLLPPKKGGPSRSAPAPMPELRRDAVGELIDDAVCVVVGCGGTVRSRGVCANHYEQARRAGWRDHLLPVKPGGRPRGRGLMLRRDDAGELVDAVTCLAEGCDAEGDIFGLCIQHWRRATAPQRDELRRHAAGRDVNAELLKENRRLSAQLSEERARSQSLLQQAARRGAVSILLRAGPPELPGVVHAVLTERIANLERWGIQDYPHGTDADGDAEMADIARDACKRAAAEGRVTWRHVLDEEMLEAFAEADPAALRAELVQVAAVTLQWLEAIDRAVAGVPPKS